MRPVGERLARLRETRVPTLLLAAVVALATWSVQFGAPGPGLDPSWRAGLFMAADQGLNFGTDVIWTYGPLGFLGNGVATVWFDGLAVGTFLYSAALYLAFCLSLVWALRRSIGTFGAVVVAILAIGLLPGAEQALVVATAAALSVLLPDRHRLAVWALVLAGALFAALQTLIKLSIGPPILAIFVVALIGGRAGGRKLTLFGALYVVDLLVLWLLSGQDLSALPDYVSTGQQIISGYSETMAFSSSPGWQLVAGVLVVAGTVLAAAFGTFRDGLARWACVLVVALAGFAIFKEGVVRFESNHVTIFFATVSVLFLLLPLPGLRRAVLLAGATALIVVTQVVVPGDFALGLHPVAAVRLAEDQAEVLLSPSRRDQLRDFGRAFDQSVYGLDERTLAALANEPVAIDPWEIGIAWAYDLDWSPLPVFQGYQDYTEELDRLNADEVASVDGPARILRVNPAKVVGEHPTRTIDGRYPSWDPPGQALATLCHFAPLRTTSRFQVLERTEDRCGEPEPAGTVDAGSGEAVDVPAAGPGEVVFVRIGGVEVSGLEKLRTLLFRAKFRYAALDGLPAVRLVPGTAADGLLLRGDPRLTGSGPFAQAPQTGSISLRGAGDDLRYEFFRMTVAPAGPGGGAPA